MPLADLVVVAVAGEGPAAAAVLLHLTKQDEQEIKLVLDVLHLLRLAFPLGVEVTDLLLN